MLDWRRQSVNLRFVGAEQMKFERAQRQVRSYKVKEYCSNQSPIRARLPEVPEAPG